MSEIHPEDRDVDDLDVEVEDDVETPDEGELDPDDDYTEDEESARLLRETRGET